MASGVTVSQECNDEYQNIKLGKKYRYIIFKLDAAMSNIEVEKTSARSSTFEDFQNDLSEAEKNGECRYTVYDYEFTIKDGDRQKLVFIFWSPDNSKIKQKMVYAASKDALLKKLGQGIAKVIHVSESVDLTEDTIIEELGLKNK